MAEPDPLEGVPESGRARLEQKKAGLFTSDLTVNEYLLIEDAGYEPLGLVLGTSIYHIGYQRRRWTRSHELEVLSGALYHARELAMHVMVARGIHTGNRKLLGEIAKRVSGLLRYFRKCGLVRSRLPAGMQSLRWEIVPTE